MLVTVGSQDLSSNKLRTQRGSFTGSKTLLLKSLRFRLENYRTHKDRDSKTLLLRVEDSDWRTLRHTKT